MSFTFFHRDNIIFLDGLILIINRHQINIESFSWVWKTKLYFTRSKLRDGSNYYLFDDEIEYSHHL